VPYFKTGLHNKEFCLWVVSQPLTVKEAKHALGEAVPDLDRHLAEGSIGNSVDVMLRPDPLMESSFYIPRA